MSRWSNKMVLVTKVSGSIPLETGPKTQINVRATNLQHVGVHGGDDVVQEVGLAGEQLLGGVSHHRLGLLGVLRSDAVPVEVR